MGQNWNIYFALIYCYLSPTHADNEQCQLSNWNHQPEQEYEVKEMFTVFRVAKPSKAPMILEVIKHIQLIMLKSICSYISVGLSTVYGMYVLT